MATPRGTVERAVAAAPEGGPDGHQALPMSKRRQRGLVLAADRAELPLPRPEPVDHQLVLREPAHEGAHTRHPQTPLVTFTGRGLHASAPRGRYEHVRICRIRRVTS